MSLRFSIPITLRSLGRGFHVVPEEEIEREPSAVPPPIDYAPLADAGRQAALWLLDVARSHTSDPLDQTSIDRVQRAVTLAFATNAPACARPDVSEEDLLTVAGILITAFEADLGVPGLGAVAGSLYDATDGDLDQIRTAIVDTLAERAAQSMIATVARSRSTRRRAGGGVPFAVRRRPRIVDEAAFDDVIIVR